jgi:prolyl-tRNA synthetase
VKDRHDRDFIIQPTSEEVITDIARQELRSYKQLPRNFYHIQTKFRDERRPRFGVMRGREFTMKDAYSFDRDEAGALKSYQDVAPMCASSTASACSTAPWRPTPAPSAAMLSHEFQVIADTGEDAIVYCPTSDYAANIELAEALPLIAARARRHRPMAEDPHAGKSTCEDVAKLLGLPLAQTVKSLVLATDDSNQPATSSRPRSGCCWCAATTPQRDQGRQAAGPEGRLPLCHRGRDRGPLRLQARLPGPDRHEEAGEGGGRPHRGQHERLRLRRQRGRLPHTGVNWGRDLPEPDSWPTSATSSKATPRPTARACWPSSAASRSAMCSTSARRSTARR